MLAIRDFFLDLIFTFLTLFRIPLFCRKISIPQLTGSSDMSLVILGNGPSLKNFLENQRDFMQDKKLLAVNHFSETKYYEELKPAIYVVSAPEYWLDDIDADFLEKRNRIFNALREKTGWSLDFFIPVAAKRNLWWKKVLDKNPHIRVHYYNTMPVEGFRAFRYMLFSLKCGMTRPHNVLIPSLMIGIWTGFKEIYLVGADHDWMKEIFVGPDNTVYLTQRHFYDAQKAKPDVMKNLGKGQRKLHEILEKFYWSFKGYHDIRRWAEPKGVRIINITPGSWIDAFERQSIE